MSRLALAVLLIAPLTAAAQEFLATRGAEPRYISVHEAAGQPMRVVLPYFRARKIAVMTLR